MARDIVIGEPDRTVIGSFVGSLKDVPAPKRGAAAICEMLRRVHLDPGRMDS